MTEAKTCLLTTCTLLPQTAKAFLELRVHGRLLFFQSIKKEEKLKKQTNKQTELKKTKADSVLLKKQITLEEKPASLQSAM